MDTMLLVILCVFYIAVVHIEGMLICPLGWEESDDACYFLNHAARVDYEEADDACNSFGAHLTTIYSMEEQNFLARRIQDDADRDFHYYYIGLNDKEEEDTFVWSDGTQLEGFTHWGSNQPNKDNDDQDCVALAPREEGTWHDFRCSFEHPYICERDKVSDECVNSLGMKDGTIQDNQITASSDYADDYIASNARLDNDKYWNAETKDTNQWIQVDFGKLRYVSGIVMQGGGDSYYNGWVTRYKVEYSKYGLSSQYIQDYNQFDDTIFYGNSDINAYVTSLFDSAIIATSITIHPTVWHEYISMRFEILGCRVSDSNMCVKPLGIKDGSIHNDKITASSQFSEYDAYNARLDGEGAWTAASNDTNQWIQVDFGTLRQVSGIVTQGSGDLRYRVWVTRYKVEYSNDGVFWQLVKDVDKINDMEYYGNSDGTTHVANLFASTIIASRIRIRPTEWNDVYISMRFEILGCEVTTPNKLRLVGGTVSSEGRLEIFHDGEWGTICDDNFDTVDANVACAKLGLGSVAHIVTDDRFCEGTGTIWLDELACLGGESSLNECPHAGWGVNNCGHYEDIGIICDPRTVTTQNELRLVGGNVSSEGRLEIYHDGEWGTICDDNFETVDANVACAKLGLGSVAHIVTDDRFGDGTGTIWLDELSCLGGESSLDECPHTGWGVNDCVHREDIGIKCDPRTVTTPNQLRLVGGTVSSEGRLEIFHDGEWGTICDDSFYTVDANVACAILGLGSMAHIVTDDRFGEGTGNIWLDDLACVGCESSLDECSHAGWGVNDCSHSEDIGIICNPRTETTMTASSPSEATTIASSTSEATTITSSTSEATTITSSTSEATTITSLTSNTTTNFTSTTSDTKTVDSRLSGDQTTNISAIAIGVAIAFVLLLIIGCIAIVVVKRRKREQDSSQSQTMIQLDSPCGNTVTNVVTSQPTYARVDKGRCSQSPVDDDAGHTTSHGVTPSDEGNQQEGWVDNDIYSRSDEEQPKRQDSDTEGWVDNSIYATSNE